MRLLFPAFLAAALLSGSGVQAGPKNPCFLADGDSSDDDSSQAPARYSSLVSAAHHRIFHGGTPVVAGFNDVDGPLFLNCRSVSGCLVTAAADLQVNTSFNICMTADGLPMHPAPLVTFNGRGEALQSRKVSVGKHMLQTKALLANDGLLYGYAIHYTMYDR